MSQNSQHSDNTPENIEKTLENYYKTVYPFYLKNGIEHSIDISGIKISCRIFIHPQSSGKILIVNGYNESYLKYAEVIYDLFQKGYSVYAYDHRGQGFSHKFPNQNGKGYLESFLDMVNDLECVFNFVKTHNENNQSIFMIAHSMGGTVTSLAASENKISPKKIVLSAPMFGIKVSPFNFLEYPIYLSTVLFTKIGFGHTYAFGQRDCFPLVQFEDNIVTNSKARYQIWQKHIREVPEVQLGGPTFQWVRESIKASRKARHLSSKNNLPILLLQAAEEVLVRNDTQDTFINSWGESATKDVILHAKHEVLMEIDTVRNTVLEKIIQYFKI